MHSPRPAGRGPAPSWTGAAVAHPNIALVKYWGKRDEALNLPAVGSLSITLDGLESRCTISPRPPGDGSEDLFVLDGRPADAGSARRMRELLAVAVPEAPGAARPALRLDCRNNFPTGAGLASSASGFAALVVALDQAAGLGLDAAALGILARRGSGSATRSLCGGFALWPAGERADGLDSFGVHLFPADHWPLEVVVVILARGPKAVGSREGMARSRSTSPFYPAWVDGSAADLAAAERAVAARDFDRLADVAEHSFRKMHAVMHTARPSLDYWTPATYGVLARLRGLREAGVPVFATSDAGPQVKAICAPGHASGVAEALGREAGVLETRVVGLGPGARRTGG